MHRFVSFTALVFIFDFCRRISHIFKNKAQTDFDLLLQRFSLPIFFNGKTEYNYVYFYQIFSCHCSLLHNQI